MRDENDVHRRPARVPAALLDHLLDRHPLVTECACDARENSWSIEDLKAHVVPCKPGLTSGKHATRELERAGHLACDAGSAGRCDVDNVGDHAHGGRKSSGSPPRKKAWT